jgi:hypothetical protein
VLSSTQRARIEDEERPASSQGRLYCEVRCHVGNSGRAEHEYDRKSRSPGLTKAQKSHSDSRLDCRFDHHGVDALHSSVVAGAWRPVSPCRCRRGGYRRLALMKSGLESGDKLAAEDTAEHLDGKEEGAA